MSEHRKWLWAGRLVALLACVASAADVSEVRVATAFVLACMMFSVSAILHAIDQAGAA